jgi:hypothetical protein
VIKPFLSSKSTLSGIYLGLLLVSICLVWWAFAPGNMNSDTVGMLMQARTRTFSDWHSPAIEMIWSLLGAGPWVVALTFFLTLGGFAFFTYSLFKLTGFSHRAACIFTILTCYTPPVLGLLGYSCKDSWVAVLFLGTLYLTICYHQRPNFLCLVLRNSALVAAILIRQEFLLIGILFLILEYFFSTAGTFRFKRLILNGAAVIGGYFALNGAIGYMEHVTKSHPVSFLYVSDLIDLSVAENRLIIPPYYLNGSDLETIREHYHYPDVNAVFYGEPPNLDYHAPMPEQEFLNLQRVWLHEVLNNPVRCLEHRLSIFKAYLWAGTYYSGVIDPNNEGLFIYHKKADALLLGYLGLFTHGLLQRHFFDFFGCPALIVLLLRFAPTTRSRKWLIVGLICAFFYQILFSAIGFPPYSRFASAGRLIFWISFYVVAGNIAITALKTSKLKGKEPVDSESIFTRMTEPK